MGLLAHRLACVVALAVGLAVAGGALAPSGARAQMADPTFEQVDATPKGTIGLGMVGAELGFIIPAVAGLHDTWAFIVFPVIGAAGGAVGGFYGIDNNDQTEVAVGTLAFGMAMIVPTMVLTLSMTAYDPEDDAEVIDASHPASEPPPTGEESAQRLPRYRAAAARVQAERMARAGTGMVRWSGDGLLVGVPGFAVRPAYSLEELQRYGAEQHTEVHFSLLSGVF